MHHPWMIPEDLAPSDAKSLTANLASIRLHRIASATDPHFESAYNELHAEFAAANELESAQILARRLARSPQDLHRGHALRYELAYLTDEAGTFAAVRDHTAIVNPATSTAVVHLSHNLIAPAWRRTGLAGWLRALPLQTARAALASQSLPPDAPITLVAEMEPADPTDPARTNRLAAYAKAGFLKLDPANLDYRQPDFRDPAEIARTGAPQPIPLSLLIRRINHPPTTQLPSDEVRKIIAALLTMYSASGLKTDPPPIPNTVALLNPTSPEPRNSPTGTDQNARTHP